MSKKTPLISQCFRVQLLKAVLDGRGTKGQYRTLIASLDRMTDLITLPMIKKKRVIRIAYHRFAINMANKNTQPRQHNLETNRLFLRSSRTYVAATTIVDYSDSGTILNECLHARKFYRRQL
jgi:hypothetical protein